MYQAAFAKHIGMIVECTIKNHTAKEFAFGEASACVMRQSGNALLICMMHACSTGH